MVEIFTTMNNPTQPINRRKVWIIDDEVDFCLLMKSYFLRKNYETHVFHVLSDALHSIRMNTPDVIFLDRDLCGNLADTQAQILEAAPNVRLIISGVHRHYNIADAFK